MSSAHTMSIVTIFDLMHFTKVTFYICSLRTWIESLVNVGGPIRKKVKGGFEMC